MQKKGEGQHFLSHTWGTWTIKGKVSLEFVNAKKWKLNKIIFKGFWMFVFAKIKMRYIWSSVVLSTVNMIFASCISLKTQTHIYKTIEIPFVISICTFDHISPTAHRTYTVPNIWPHLTHSVQNLHCPKHNQKVRTKTEPDIYRYICPCPLCLLMILVQEKPPKHCLTCRQWVGEKLRGKHGHYYHKGGS